MPKSKEKIYGDSQTHRRQRDHGQIAKRREKNRKRSNSPGEIKNIEQKRKKFQKLNEETHRHRQLCNAVNVALRDIISNEECLQDIPLDCTPEELKAKIALEKEEATTVYVKRDGLPTLTVVLPNINPNVANLKRAIELTANLQIKREKQKLKRTKRITEKRKKSGEIVNDSDGRQFRKTDRITGSIGVSSYSGDLVCSSARCGIIQRESVSWRFLWRAYALCKEEADAKPFNDSNGRQLLKNFGITDNSTLKFVKRERYFGRQRQRS